MTSSPWHKRFGARIGKAVLSCSLLLAGYAFAADYSAYSRRLHGAKSEQAKVQILGQLYDDETIDEELQQALYDLLNEESYAITVKQAESMIDLRAFAEQATEAPAPADAIEKAKEIKRNPLYRDPGDKQESNWFAKGFEKLGEVLKNWLDALFRSRQTPDLPNIAASRTPFDILQVVFWILLFGVVGLFLFFVIKHFSWKQRLERRAKAMLSEEEPELTKDEYLVEADRLTAEGRYREAVRHLYLACLLLFDEGGVARFIRGQTNWEHLRRIELSEKLPLGLDFRPATQKFDLVWYGMKVEGQTDVVEMRAWYGLIADQLRRKAA